ncbi:hypothetical protein HK097_001990 [Rhizophlyctis rosea]|uniref:PRISE-like Rossmann-fold domain-containing protein n=1 Tax=Rhizophlyctis rosea TaxID=64517 RepID=A0AAD5X803_9FUNG|nr:hypothetical protein HK097_001990 [Rhizophlyctis rosea]
MLAALHASTTFRLIITVSRRDPQLPYKDSRIRSISVDLLTAPLTEVADKLREAGAADATHAFHYTYIEKKDEAESVDVNGRLLSNALAATASVAKVLSCFQLQTGYKYYGVHKGGSELAKQPFKEDSPRGAGPNFYYTQEDLLVRFCATHNWQYIITRPNHIIGVAKGNFMNLAVSIALYATLCREQKKPFKFPGNQVSWNAVTDHSAAENNAAFQLWAAENLEKTKGKAFNICNGDQVRFRDLWPKIAKYGDSHLKEYFDVSLPSDRDAFTIPEPKSGETANQIVMAKEMPGQLDVWEPIAKKYNLDPSAYKYATWDFIDFITGLTWSMNGDMSAARQAGWITTVDTFEMFRKAFDRMKELKIIPA